MITHFLNYITYTIPQLLAKKSLPLTELYEKKKKKAKEHQEEILKAVLTYFTQAQSHGGETCTLSVYLRKWRKWTVTANGYRLSS